MPRPAFLHRIWRKESPVRYAVPVITRAPAELAEEIPDQEELKLRKKEAERAGVKSERLSERAGNLKENLDLEIKRIVELPAVLKADLYNRISEISDPAECMTAAQTGDNKDGERTL